MNKVEKALEIHAASFNCAQSVFLPYAADYGVDEQLALKIATCFGAGAKCGNICGAASGGLMVLGLKYGHIDADNPDQKKRSGEIAADFLARAAAVGCREAALTYARALLDGSLGERDPRGAKALAKPYARRFPTEILLLLYFFSEKKKIR